MSTYVLRRRPRICMYPTAWNRQTLAYFYFLTCLACLTKFSITPSNASFSPICASRRFNQYSNTSLARTAILSSCAMCCLSSSSVKLSSAASVVAHKRRTAERSSSGGGSRPRRRGGRLRDVERAESRRVEECPW